MSTSETAVPPEERREPHRGEYIVNIDGTEYKWGQDDITVPQIRTLGKLPPDVPVLEIDLQTNVSRTLAEDAVIELRAGHAFAKKHRFQRG